ncbi:MAG TPA: hypothetical protein DCR14_04015 [Acidimicrobiaceae bacterium]|nr:hypothetical protein [Acidimicrobiaceae bacterium]
MADDDEMMEPDEFEEEVEVDDDLEPAELDEAELDEDALEVDELDEDDEFGGLDDEFTDDTDDDDESEGTAGPVRRSVSEDEDEDEELLAPDDVEADLDTILKDRLVAVDEDDENEDDEPEERGESADRLQPKRADEQLCPSCFLLVRQSAPGCPVGDDECPLFRS